MFNEVLYTAVVLDKISAQLLEKEFRKYITQNWEWIGHHMTIQLGQLPLDMREELIGRNITLKVESLGIDDVVIAVGVSGCYSKNNNPHITLAVNRVKGGKPRMSNEIYSWKPYKGELILTGIVKEIY